MGQAIEEAAGDGEAELKAKQRGVMRGAGAAFAVTIGLYVLAGFLPNIGAAAGLIWASAALGPIFCLFMAVGAQGNHRFFSRGDIDAAAGGPPTDQARMLQAIIQNTLEQAALALPVYGILAFQDPGSALPFLLAAAFVVGRAAFSFGYARGGPGRAFGFGLTAYPTALALAYSAFLVAKDWF